MVHSFARNNANPNGTNDDADSSSSSSSTDNARFSDPYLARNTRTSKTTTRISEEVGGLSLARHSEEASMLITHFNRTAIDKYEQRFAEEHRFTGPALDKSQNAVNAGGSDGADGEAADDADSDIEVDFSSDDDSDAENDC